MGNNTALLKVLADFKKRRNGFSTSSLKIVHLAGHPIVSYSSGFKLNHVAKMIDFQNTLPLWFSLYASSILVSHFIIYKGKNGPRRLGDFPSQEH